VFCPKCKAEYREGFTECYDCQVPLVPELPPEQEREYIDFETVFATGNQAIIAVAKSILDYAGIQYLVLGEGLRVVYGINPAVWPYEIRVVKDDVEEARKLLEGLKENSSDDVK